MSKIKILLVISVLFSILQDSSKEKYFQGVITYNMDYTDKTGEMSKEESKQYIGNEQKYFIRGSKYKSVMNGLLKLTQFYTGNDTLYSTMKGVKAVMYIDTKKQEEKIVSSIIKKKEMLILGYDCNVLEVETTGGTMKYYFNESLKVDKDLYKNHKKGFWYYCLNKTEGALPLRWETDTSELKLMIEAKKVDYRILGSSVFQIPKGLPIMKSPE